MYWLAAERRLADLHRAIQMDRTRFEMEGQQELVDRLEAALYAVGAASLVATGMLGRS